MNVPNSATSLFFWLLLHVSTEKTSIEEEKGRKGRGKGHGGFG